MEMSTHEKTVSDSDLCVPVKHVAKLNRMRGQTSTSLLILRLLVFNGSEREISPPRSQVYVFPA